MTEYKTRSVFERTNIIAKADLFEAARKLEAHDSQRQAGRREIRAIGK
jgi:hypothetical protein